MVRAPDGDEHGLVDVLLEVPRVDAVLFAQRVVVPLSQHEHLVLDHVDEFGVLGDTLPVMDELVLVFFEVGSQGLDVVPSKDVPNGACVAVPNTTTGCSSKPPTV